MKIITCKGLIYSWSVFKVVCIIVKRDGGLLCVILYCVGENVKAIKVAGRKLSFNGKVCDWAAECCSLSCHSQYITPLAIFFSNLVSSFSLTLIPSLSSHPKDPFSASSTPVQKNS